MAIKRRGEDCLDAFPPKRRLSGLSVPTQRRTRSKSKHQQAVADSEAPARDSKPCPNWNNDTHSLSKMEIPGLGDPEQPVLRQPQPLPLTREALQLLNGANSAMANTTTTQSGTSKASAGSINAYDPRYEAALNERKVFFFEEVAHKLPSDFEKVKAAVFEYSDTAVPPKGQAGLLRDLLAGIKSESDVVTFLLPKIVPVEELKRNKSETAVSVNALWRHCLALDSNMDPPITTPKPDMTIGWSPIPFPFDKAYKFLASFAKPVVSEASVTWPLFTVELKGEDGCLRHARLQNLHNAAVMLSNLRELLKAAGKEDEFFDKIHVLSLELTLDVIQLSCYWATRLKDGSVGYYGKVIDGWFNKSKQDATLDEAYRCVQNAIKLVRSRALHLVHSSMDIVQQLCETNSAGQVPSRSSICNKTIRQSSPTKESSTASGSSTKTRKTAPRKAAPRKAATRKAASRKTRKTASK